MASLALSLATCASSTKELKVVTTTAKVSVAKQGKPRSLNIASPKFIVITAGNFEKYREQLVSGNGAIYGLSEEGYKQLLKNQAEYQRYIKQQNANIVFYESNL